MDNNSNNNNTQPIDTLLLNKKIENYGKNNDFVAPRELTVTITLAEYRELVNYNAKASSEYEKLRDKVWKLEAENKKLNETIEALKTVCPMNAPKDTTNEERN